MTARTFDQLVEVLHGRVVGQNWTGLSAVAACPACDGRLVFWTRRPGPSDRPGYKCWDCGRAGDLVGLHLLVEKQLDYQRRLRRLWDERHVVAA